jgi:hypothetical protein
VKSISERRDRNEGKDERKGRQRRLGQLVR